jgi:hypothetical protein
MQCVARDQEMTEALRGLISDFIERAERAGKQNNAGTANTGG